MWLRPHAGLYNCGGRRRLARDLPFHGTVLDLLKMLPGIGTVKENHTNTRGKGGYQPRPQKSFAELVRDTGLTEEEQETR